MAAKPSDWSWLSFLLGLSGGALVASWWIKSQAAAPSSTAVAQNTP